MRLWERPFVRHVSWCGCTVGRALVSSRERLQPSGKDERNTKQEYVEESPARNAIACTANSGSLLAIRRAPYERSEISVVF